MDENIHDNKREFLVDYYNVDINNHKNKINQGKFYLTFFFQIILF